MAEYFFVSDLHGSEHRYSQLFRTIRERVPSAVFLGGDLFQPVRPILDKDLKSCPAIFSEQDLHRIDADSISNLLIQKYIVGSHR